MAPHPNVIVSAYVTLPPIHPYFFPFPLKPRAAVTLPDLAFLWRTATFKDWGTQKPFRHTSGKIHFGMKAAANPRSPGCSSGNEFIIVFSFRQWDTADSEFCSSQIVSLLLRTVLFVLYVFCGFSQYIPCKLLYVVLSPLGAQHSHASTINRKGGAVLLCNGACSVTV
jgi:hypothetical protein